MHGDDYSVDLTLFLLKGGAILLDKWKGDRDSYWSAKIDNISLSPPWSRSGH
jgi:hypothetical protein